MVSLTGRLSAEPRAAARPLPPARLRSRPTQARCTLETISTSRLLVREHDSCYLPFLSLSLLPPPGTAASALFTKTVCELVLRALLGLAVIETTIGNSNPELYKFVQPTTVLEWIRNIVANRNAKDAKSWQEVWLRRRLR